VLVNGYRAMWAIVLFDLPVRTKPQRRLAASFRKGLLEDGFWMLQYSVYARPCPSEESARVHARRVRRLLPPEGQVRILQMTDKQYGRMECFHGKLVQDVEHQPRQLEFF
jgi:CRISPR-associated protein Cas2